MIWENREISAFNENILKFVETASQEPHVADLCGVVFPGNIEFCSGKTRPENFPAILLRKAQFKEDANFTDLLFSGIADFTEMNVFGDAFFKWRTEFRGFANFSGTNFFRDVYFERASFHNDITLKKTNFIGKLYFAQVQCFGDVDFTEAQFCSYANFHNVLFSELAIFEKTIFADDVDFSCRVIGGPNHSRDGASATGDFFRRIQFMSTEFKGAARFANRRFLEETDFSHTVFEIAPDFHNTTLHQDTDFSAAKFKQRKGGEAARAYRTLKLAMELRRARREEGMFHALEQRSLLFSSETTSPEKIVSFLYWVSANYGQAVWRPFLWLIGLQVIFVGLYPLVFPQLSGLSWDQIVRFTLQQVFRPFYVFRQTVGSGDPYALSLVLTTAVQSLATYGLLALFLLALRRRFRMA